MPAPEKVLVSKLVYTNLQSFLQDQLLFTQSKGVDAIQAHIVPNDPIDAEARIRYVDEELPGNVALFSEDLARVCNISPNLIFIKETSFKTHVMRVPPILSNSGLEKNNPAHLHCCVFMPDSTSQVFLLIVK